MSDATALCELDEQGRLKLKAKRCRCGTYSFPAQMLGCEMCGRSGDDLDDVALEPDATLISWVTVHLHSRPAPKAPFLVGRLALATGPVLRTIIDPSPETELRPGLPMVGRLVMSDSVGADAGAELRFSPKEVAREQQHG